MATTNVWQGSSEASELAAASTRELEEENPEPPRIRCPLSRWSPRKEDKWFAPAGMNGTRSTPEASVQPAFTSGLKPSASRAVDGLRTRCGIRSEAKLVYPHFLLKRHTMVS